MATVIQPPFYVPRPADETYWSGAPAPSPVLSFLTQQKMFGKGGQVPTKQWRWDHDVAESFWKAAPINSPIIAYLTKQIMFGIGGQVPAKRWNHLYDFDTAESFWNASPLKSPIIIYLTKQIIFGAGGQVPAKQWRYDFDDNFSAWSFTFTHRNQAIITPVMPNGIRQQRYDYNIAESDWAAAPVDSPIIAYLTKQIMFSKGGQVPAKQWHYDFDDNFSAWFPWINRNLSTLTPSAKPFFRASWKPDYDDPSLWNGGPSSSAIIPFLTKQIMFGKGGQVVARQWRYDYDDVSVWLGKPNSSAFIQLGQVKNRPQRYDYDDTSTWWNWIGRNLPISIPAINPFIAVINQNYNDDAPAWLGKPVNSTIIQFLTVGGKIVIKQQRHDNDDAPIWWNWINHNLLVSTPQAKPFITVNWNNYDDSSIWSGGPIDSAPIQLLTVQKIFGAGGQVPIKQWRYDQDDASAWQSVSYRNNAVLISSATPFLSHRWDFNTDDSLWQGKSSNQIAALSLAPYRINYQFPVLMDDAVDWIGVRRPISIVLTVAPFFGYRRNAIVDDWSSWQWRPTSQAVLFVTPFRIRNRFPAFMDDAVDWIGTHKSMPINMLITAQPFLPFTQSKRNWNYYYDDAIDWIGTHKAVPYVISALTFMIALFERVAHTRAESRTAITSAEPRIAKTVIENRTAIAPEDNE